MLLRIILCAFLAASVIPANNAQAACAGALPVWGTGDDRASCAEKKKLKKAAVQLKIAEEKAAQERRRKKLEEDSDPGVAQNVINFGKDMLGTNDREEEREYQIPKWRIRTELMGYVWPNAYQSDKGGLPKRFFFNGYAPEYFINRNLGFGLLWQEWERDGTQSFDPIMAGQRDGSGDEAIFFPGVDRLSYRLIMPYVSLNAELWTEKWIVIGRFGIGQTRLDVKYDDVDAAAHPFARQSEDVTYTDNSSFMIDLGVEHRFHGGNSAGCAVRVVEAAHETSDYLDRVGMGHTGFLCYVSWGLSTMGLLE